MSWFICRRVIIPTQYIFTYTAPRSDMNLFIFIVHCVECTIYMVQYNCCIHCIHLDYSPTWQLCPNFYQSAFSKRLNAKRQIMFLYIFCTCNLFPQILSTEKHKMNMSLFPINIMHSLQWTRTSPFWRRIAPRDNLWIIHDVIHVTILNSSILLELSVRYLNIFLSSCFYCTRFLKPGSYPIPHTIHTM